MIPANATATPSRFCTDRFPSKKTKPQSRTRESFAWPTML